MTFSEGGERRAQKLLCVCGWKNHDKAPFKLFKVKTLVDLVNKAFVNLHLDYPGNLEGIKDTKKTRNVQAALFK